MVPFEYFQKLEEECLGYYRHFIEMNLKEKFDSFVPDKILYEKKWKCKFPPFLGSYDHFFHPFDKIKRPKRINLHHDSACFPYESISLILDNGRRYAEMLYSRRQIEKDGFANPWGEITESILSDDGISFDQYRKSTYFYDHKKYIKESNGDFCYTVVDSKYISKHRFFEYNQPESAEEKEEQEQCYQRFLMAGFQEV